MRVIHIVENLHRGAVENWLVRMLRHAVDSGVRVDWTFYCTLGQEGKLDAEARRLGAKIVHSPVPLRKKRAFLKALRSELRHGHYDALHAHHDLVSAVYLLAARGMRLKQRIVHVHNADEAVLTPHPLKKWMLRLIFRQVCLTLSSRIVGISQHTLDTFLAGRRRQPGRDRVHYYGIDATPFLKARVERDTFRRDLGLPTDAQILLFAGRIVPEKNPLFAVDVFAEMRRRNPRVAAVFVGAGSLEGAVRQRVEELRMQDRFCALGWRDDLPEIMVQCDWFILPRPEHPLEGLGIALVEAQLAGLRLLLSKGIADDPILPEAVVARLPLASGPAKWAEAALDLMNQSPPDQDRIEKLHAQSPFNLDFALRDLLLLHAET